MRFARRAVRTPSTRIFISVSAVNKKKKAGGPCSRPNRLVQLVDQIVWRFSAQGLLSFVPTS
jgi:hypothetical protein